MEFYEYPLQILKFETTKVMRTKTSGTRFSLNTRKQQQVMQDD